jgi:cytochrome b pre-mRNA-processing protein 3
LTTTTPKLQQQAQQPNNPSTTTAAAADDASTMQKFAQRMRAQKQMRAATEPYVAYGATEDLYRVCAVAGDYGVPARVEGEEPLRSEKGEDLGLPVGWWYEGMFFYLFFFFFPFFSFFPFLSLFPLSLLFLFFPCSLANMISSPPLPELGLSPTFNTWAQITMLHIYLVTVRLRMFPAAHAHHWHQNLLDHYFYAAEDRMVTIHNMAARSVRNKYLKDLFVQWRGVLAAYDEALARNSDAVLAAAVWRNVFGGDENVDVAAVAQVVSYVKRNLRDLGRLADTEVAAGDIRFSDPARESTVVGAKADGMNKVGGDVAPAAAPAGSVKKQK